MSESKRPIESAQGTMSFRVTPERSMEVKMDLELPDDETVDGTSVAISVCLASYAYAVTKLLQEKEDELIDIMEARAGELMGKIISGEWKEELDEIEKAGFTSTVPGSQDIH